MIVVVVAVELVVAAVAAVAVVAVVDVAAFSFLDCSGSDFAYVVFGYH